MVFEFADYRGVKHCRYVYWLCCGIGEGVGENGFEVIEQCFCWIADREYGVCAGGVDRQCLNVTCQSY